ncbi:MAG: ATP-grasp fold amidoligase family protein [Solirubrobacterales bacterium]
MNWRIIHDRRARLALACDKLAAKEDVGKRFDLVKTVPTLWQGNDLNELTEVSLPDCWVLKPNHAAGFVCFGMGKVEPSSIPDLTRATKGWLEFDKSVRDGEWAYGTARKMFLVEPMIGGGPNPPIDLKGYVFGGRLAFWHLDLGRGRDQRRAFFSAEGSRLEVRLRYPDAGHVEPPANLAAMNRAAEELAEGLDMARVDLYSVEGEIIFGELTVYPSGALEMPLPEGLDEQWGRLWNLPSKLT